MKAFTKEATASGYDTVVRTCIKYTDPAAWRAIQRLMAAEADVHALSSDEEEEAGTDLSSD